MPNEPLQEPQEPSAPAAEPSAPAQQPGSRTEASAQPQPQPETPKEEPAPKRKRAASTKTAKSADPAAEQGTAEAAPKPRRKRSTAGTKKTAGSRAQGPVYQSAYAQQTPYQPVRRPIAKKRQGPVIPWWLVVLGFIIATPAGIALLIINIVIGGTRAQIAKSGRRANPYSPAQDTDTMQNPAAKQPQQDGDRRKADLLMTAGVLLSILGGLSSAAMLFGNLWILTDLGDIAWFLEEFWPAAMLLLAGLGLCFGAHRIRTSWLTRRKITNIVGNADHMYIADIAAALGCSTDKCIDHLENCILKGTFGPAAYLDLHSMALVVRGAAPEPPAKVQPAAPPQPEPNPQPQQPKQQEQPAEDDRYTKILKELRRINDAIPDEEMSAKISRLETVSGKIFAQLKEDPDKLPQLRKFMDYYLPTSLKLLDTYAELDAQGVEGANISESKRRIEQSMDTLVTAFENQLDKLFQDDALDVSADIEVMEKMLYADGLAGDSDPFGLHSGH